MTTLQEAIDCGRGDERPFRCTEHDDRNASASVNVVKGVWYCYVCHAKGHVDKKKAPSATELAAMMQPERNCRVYPESYLELFTVEPKGTYWQTRFPDWLVWWGQFGQDPISGESTFPVKTPEGRIAGVGRRQDDKAVALAKETGGNASRYKYPRRWSASRVMHSQGSPKGDVLVLTEGAADAMSLWQVGIPAFACYGSGLHHPQREFVLRAKPKAIVLGMDNDEAGERGAGISLGVLGEVTADIIRITWPKNDPADCSPDERVATIASVVGQRYLPEWSNAVAQMQAAFHEHEDEMTNG